MPSALPGLSVGKAAELLQQTDRLIKTVPEVASVFGKAGRAETATDPAPLEMFETTIQFKPRDQWRAGMTPDKLVEELDRVVKRAGPGQHLGAADPQPHRHAGHRHQEPGRRQGRRRRPARRSTASPREIERAVKDVPGVTVGARRAPDRRALHRRRHRPRRRGALRPQHRRRAGGGLVGRSAARTSARPSKACSAFRSTCAIRARCAIRWRSCASCRSSPSAARRSCSATSPTIRITDGPPMLRSENARLSGWVYVDIRGRDLRVGGARDAARRRRRRCKLPPGYSVSWSGQFEYLERADRQAEARRARSRC